MDAGQLFFAFIVLAPFIAITIIGMALFSWFTSKVIGYINHRRRRRETSFSSVFSKRGGRRHRRRNNNDNKGRRSSSSPSTISLSSYGSSSSTGVPPSPSSPSSVSAFHGDQELSSMPWTPVTIDEYPLVTLQFLGLNHHDNNHNHNNHYSPDDVLFDFLLNLNEYVDWPLERLEVLVCLHHHHHHHHYHSGHTNNDSNNNIDADMEYDYDQEGWDTISVATYDLMLNLMTDHEGFHIRVVATSSSNQPCPVVVRGSFVFTFDSITDLMAHPATFLNDFMSAAAVTASNTPNSTTTTTTTTVSQQQEQQQQQVVVGDFPTTTAKTTVTTTTTTEVDVEHGSINIMMYDEESDVDDYEEDTIEFA